MRPTPSLDGSPDDAPRQVSRHGFATSYVAEAISIPLARCALRAFAEAGGATAAQLDDIALASSEAVTNVVRHAYIGTKGDVHVRASATPRRLCIVVTDDGVGLAHITPNPGLGRGLDLMRHASDALTLEDRPGGGVNVTMSFVLAAAG